MKEVGIYHLKCVAKIGNGLDFMNINVGY